MHSLPHYVPPLIVAFFMFFTVIVLMNNRNKEREVDQEHLILVFTN